MSDTASQFVGNIPANYDTGLGPYLFEDYAIDLAERAADLQPLHVLELAAGTGIVSRALRDHLPDDVSLTITDLNLPMLEVAQGKFITDKNVDFKTADAMALPFADDSFDLIVCQFGVMFFPNKVAAFAEANRVLRPGGKCLINVWGSMVDNPFSQICNDVAAECFPDDPPGFYKVPFHYFDAKVVLDDMAAGGFANISSEIIDIQKKITNWQPFARGLVHGNPLIDEIEARGGIEPDTVAASFLAKLEQAFGPVPTSMPLRATVYCGEAS